MKNLEKIAIDTIIAEFQHKNIELIQASISAKTAAEMAQQNFKKTITPVINYAKESAVILIQDEVSDDAIKYYEDKIADIIKIPFKLKN